MHHQFKPAERSPFKPAERSPQLVSLAQGRQAELSAFPNRLEDTWAANPTLTAPAPKQYPGPIVTAPSDYGQLQDYDYVDRRQRSIYGQAEAALFEALKPDFARQFGADVAVMVDDVAATVYPKAIAIYDQAATREDTTEVKIRRREH